MHKPDLSERKSPRQSVRGSLWGTRRGIRIVMSLCVPHPNDTPCSCRSHGKVHCLQRTTYGLVFDKAMQALASLKLREHQRHSRACS